MAGEIKKWLSDDGSVYDELLALRADVAALTALIGGFVRSSYVSGIRHAVAVPDDRAKSLLLAAEVADCFSANTAPSKDFSP